MMRRRTFVRFIEKQPLVHHQESFLERGQYRTGKARLEAPRPAWDAVGWIEPIAAPHVMARARFPVAQGRRPSRPSSYKSASPLGLVSTCSTSTRIASPDFPAPDRPPTPTTDPEDATMGNNQFSVQNQTDRPLVVMWAKKQNVVASFQAAADARSPVGFKVVAEAQGVVALGSDATRFWLSKEEIVRNGKKTFPMDGDVAYLTVLAKRTGWNVGYKVVVYQRPVRDGHVVTITEPECKACMIHWGGPDLANALGRMMAKEQR